MSPDFGKEQVSVETFAEHWDTITDMNEMSIQSPDLRYQQDMVRKAVE